MEVWEQQEGESDEAYVRFQYYMHLGPTRSMEAAYYWYLNSGEVETEEKGLQKAPKSTKKPKVPGSWKQESIKYQWPFRASKWDIYKLSIHGKSAISTFYEIIDEITRQHLDAIRKGKLIPSSYAEMMEGLQILGQFNSAEAAAAWALDSNIKPDAVHEQPKNVSSIDAKRDQQRRA